MEDVNDNPPQLNAVSYSGMVREDAPPGTPLTLNPTVQVCIRSSSAVCLYYSVSSVESI